MSKPPLPQDLEVYIESYDPQGRGTYISEHFEFMRSRLTFNSIRMDEYGGPNVAATLPDETQTALRKLGLDNDSVDDLVTSLQRKIMEGEIHLQLQQDSSGSAQDQFPIGIN